MIWTAIVPLKLRALRKSRLASCMSLQERQTLSDRMAARVLAALDEAGVPAGVLWPVPWAGWPWGPD